MFTRKYFKIYIYVVANPNGFLGRIGKKLPYKSVIYVTSLDRGLPTPDLWENLVKS